METRIQFNSCNSNRMGFESLVELDDFSNYRIFGYISKIYGKKIKRGKYPNCGKSEMFKCRTDIFNYVLTYLI